MKPNFLTIAMKPYRPTYESFVVSNLHVEYCPRNDLDRDSRYRYSLALKITEHSFFFTGRASRALDVEQRNILLPYNEQYIDFLSSRVKPTQQQPLDSWNACRVNVLCQVSRYDRHREGYRKEHQ